MRKILSVNFLSLVLLVSACAPQIPVVGNVAPTLTKTRIATATETLLLPKTPAVQASPTFTPEPPVPTNVPGCINSAAFVADVTVADNSIIPAGTTFTKTWRVRNTGTCTWGSDYTLAYYSAERMFAPFSVPLSLTFPNQTVDLSVQMIAPNTTGTHQGFFVIKNPAGLIMKVDKDSRLWVVINVSSEVANAPTAAQGSGSIPITGNTNAACAFTADTARVTEAINSINTYRAQNGLPAYSVNESLVKAATAHANDMACNKLFDHIGSDASTPTTRVAGSGYPAASVTENVYCSYPPLSGQGVVDWWKNDQTDIRHNQNLLNATYTEIGVAYSYFNNFGCYVAVFARPK